MSKEIEEKVRLLGALAKCASKTIAERDPVEKIFINNGALQAVVVTSVIASFAWTNETPPVGLDMLFFKFSQTIPTIEYDDDSTSIVLYWELGENIKDLTSEEFGELIKKDAENPYLSEFEEKFINEACVNVLDILSSKDLSSGGNLTQRQKIRTAQYMVMQDYYSLFRTEEYRNILNGELNPDSATYEDIRLSTCNSYIDKEARGRIYAKVSKGLDVFSEIFEDCDNKDLEVKF